MRRRLQNIIKLKVHGKRLLPISSQIIILKNHHSCESADWEKALLVGLPWRACLQATRLATNEITILTRKKTAIRHFNGKKKAIHNSRQYPYHHHILEWALACMISIHYINNYCLYHWYTVFRVQARPLFRPTVRGQSLQQMFTYDDSFRPLVW